MTKKKHKSKFSDGQVSEPSTSSLSKKEITIYSGFEDMERSKIEYTIHTDPVTRTKNVVDLIRQIYGEEKCLPGTNPKILYFKD